LFEEAQLNKWYPAMAGKRHWLPFEYSEELALLRMSADKV